jgi:hypothetical protein
MNRTVRILIAVVVFLTVDGLSIDGSQPQPSVASAIHHAGRAQRVTPKRRRKKREEQAQQEPEQKKETLLGQAQRCKGDPLCGL